MNKKMDDSEMVDRATRMGAPGEPQTNGLPADRLAEWDAILDAVRAEKTSLSAMNARVVDRVMANLRFVEAPHANPEPVRPRAGIWRQVGGLSAASALVFAAALVAVQSIRTIERAPAPAIESAKVRIDRSDDHIRVDLAPDAWSLQQALDVVPAGSRVRMPAIEVGGAFVLQRPMTIDSQSGPIVIGRS